MTAPPAPPRPAGFVLTGDAGGRFPVVVASPHSGRDYPANFLARTRLTIAQLRRGEDAYVDGLLDGVAASDVPRLAARYGRSWLDLNRGPDELDPAMYVEPLDATPAQASDRVRSGLGVVPRIAAAGLDIYPTRLRVADARERLANVHAPWHDTLAQLLAVARARHGFAILLDCHSMPAPVGGPGAAPQIVVGDLHGQSAAPALVARVEAHFAAAGWRTARNRPYAGGYTTARHGDPANGIHAVQIEIDRALYMDPARLTRHMGFPSVAAQLTTLVAALCDEPIDLRPDLPFAEAAE